jgi:hypothetical protein
MEEIERKKAYAIKKFNTLIKEIEYIRDNKIDDEIKTKFLNLSSLLSIWEAETIYMGYTVETDEERKYRNERKERLRLGLE